MKITTQRKLKSLPTSQADPECNLKNIDENEWKLPQEPKAEPSPQKRVKIYEIVF